MARTVDPFNEPSSNYWWAGNNQEASASSFYSVSEYSAIMYVNHKVTCLAVILQSNNVFIREAHLCKEFPIFFQGCHFGVAAQNVILVKLWNSLAKAELIDSGVSISASDETSIDLQCQTMYNYSPDALGTIAQINTHCVRC